MNTEHVRQLLSTFNNPSVSTLLNATTGWPEEYTCTFIQPGLVSYEDANLGLAMVSKETLDKMLPSFIGKPVVRRDDHRDGMGPEQFKKIAVGVVTDAWFDANSGWFMCSFIVWDDEAKVDITVRKYSVSCAYVMLDCNDEGGVHNQIKYDGEVLDGEYSHLALVPNPRYTGAQIFLNSIGGSMKITAWFSKKVEEMKGKQLKNEVDIATDAVEVDGKRVLIKELINAVKKTEALNSVELGEDSEFTIDGKVYTLKNMIESYKKTLKNDAKQCANCGKVKNECNCKDGFVAKNEEESKEEDEREHKEKEVKNKKTTKNADEQKEEEEEMEKAEEKKNAEEEKEKEKKKEEVKNSDGKKCFMSLKNAAEQRKGSGPAVEVNTDKIARGKELYGSYK